MVLIKITTNNPFDHQAFWSYLSVKGKLPAASIPVQAY